MKEAVTNAVIDKVAPVSDAAPESLWTNPETWIVVAFVIFMALFVRYLAPMIGKGLDARSATIRDQLEQASRLRSEAEALLAHYQHEQQELLKQAKAIVATAQSDAAALRASAAEELKLALDRRSQQAQDKIARAEREAVAQIRTHIIESATEMARDMLAAQATSASDDQAVARAIATIEQQVH